MLKQISIFIENKPGRIADVTGCLAEKDINLHALSIADTTDFGILRLIVSDPDKAKEILRGKGIMVKTIDVIPVALEHTPGSLHKVLKELETLDINIEYMYAFTSRSKDHDAIVILRLNNQDEAFEKLKDSKVKVLGDDLLDKLNSNE